MANPDSPRAALPSPRERFAAKVELLERWGVAGAAPPGEFVPRGPVDLRRWASKKYSLFPWKSPNVVSAEANRDLRVRFDRAVAKLKGARRATGQGGSIAELQEHNISLAEQVDVLLQEKRKTDGELIRTKHKLALAERRIAEVTASLRSVTRLDIVK